MQKRITIRNIGIPLLFLSLSCITIKCVDPFYPNLKRVKSLLVVDALLTNEDRSYSVILSRTRQSQNAEPEMVSGAEVVIKDQNGNSSMMQETTAGRYKTDSLLFQGESGHTYVLHIRTPDGTEYESDPCIMYPVKQIDRIYFNKDQEFQNNGTEVQDGIRIFIDSEKSDDGKYFRWVYNECWKFSIPTPKKYDYIDETHIPEVSQPKQVCYCYNASGEIIIHSTESSQGNSIEKEPILFIASALSDRLLIRYSIEVKQLSISEKEYHFWELMNQVNEGGGGIFEKQPFSVTGNIHNLNDPSEQVLGYFQVSSVEKKRIFITRKEIDALDILVFKYDCDRIAKGPQDFLPSITFDKIYAYFTTAGAYFIAPEYGMSGALQRLVFASPECADCTVRGRLAKPDFWIDI